MTAGELARELEVSERTVHRDVDALSEAGVPIYAERGPHGGVQLVDGYRTRLTGMTADEAEALFLSGLPGPAAELGLGTVVTAARLKVMAALPPELRARASRLVERFHLDAAGWFKAGEAVPHLPTLAEGVWEERRVRIVYDRGDSSVERLLEPLGLVIKGGTWYLVAVAEQGQIRTFRVARVAEATLTEERFGRPDGFDLAGYWTESIAAYEREAPRLEVLVRVDPEWIPMLADSVGGGAVDAAERVAPAETGDADGWWHMRLRLDWPREAPGRLLAMGAHLEVLQPADLRQRLTDLAREVLGRYPA
jgi:predicted DNA-binding transcriptional regulator YafY